MDDYRLAVLFLVFVLKPLAGWKKKSRVIEVVAGVGKRLLIVRA